MLKTYRNLSSLYYHYDIPQAPAQELAFYMQYAKHAQGHILEPMCGTGNYLIPFMQAGYAIEGFDASRFMLDILNEKCRNAHIKPLVWQGFLQDLHKPYPYDLIFIPSGSFGLITDETEALQCLRVINKHLSTNGLFVFEAETMHTLPEALNTWYQDAAYGPNNEIVVRNTFPQTPKDNVVTVICRYDLIKQQQVIQTETEDFKLRLYSKDEMIDLLNKAGFSEIRAVKAYDKTHAPDADDATIVYECRKSLSK